MQNLSTMHVEFLFLFLFLKLKKNSLNVKETHAQNLFNLMKKKKKKKKTTNINLLIGRVGLGRRRKEYTTKLYGLVGEDNNT